MKLIWRLDEITGDMTSSCGYHRITFVQFGDATAWQWRNNDWMRLGDYPLVAMAMQVCQEARDARIEKHRLRREFGRMAGV